MNEKLSKIFDIGLSIWILLDLIFLICSLVFILSPQLYHNLIFFDTALCAVLLTEFFYRFFRAENRKDFLIKNWTELIAGIPFDLIMFPFIANDTMAILLKVFKFFRILILCIQLFEVIKIFLKDTYLDEILGILALTIITFTLSLYLFDPSMNSLFDSLWFVVSSLTTVGYGDVLPDSMIGKVISLILLIVGVLIFSAITAALASYFNKKLLNEGTEELKTIKDKLDSNEKELKELKEEIALLNKKLGEK
ncbi:potassium channel family protein [Methanobrevibacter sp.]|uniref:potassium channel family protein n=1 Tax=Methanobrevibacter sp. TaxID=66852 RepID=UPI00386A524F